MICPRRCLLAMLCAPLAALADDSAPTAAGWQRWFNPTTAPFIPVPEIDVDPLSGTTVGLILTWLDTDTNGDIRRIYAPDIYRTPHFGYGVHARVFEYPSEDTQWSLVGGIEQRVESTFDAEYQTGRTRHGLLSFNVSAIYDRSGTPRFYGIGNESPAIDVSGYTEEQKSLEAHFGLNLNPTWQLTYTTRVRAVKVLPGTITGTVPLARRFGRIAGVGLTNEWLNRFSLTYDTRDDLTVPTRGGQIVAYGGFASRNQVFDESLYSEAGTDARYYWPVGATIIAAHFALRYEPTTHSVPFWALSSIGGDTSVIGGEQPLRGFGEGRFYGRNSVSASLELRHRVASFDAASTHVDLELAPFTDFGRVFSNPRSLPLTQLHHVFGLGIRAIAKPFVVAYVDVGYGSAGAAAFTGLDYPF
jgi:outer membrane protein assembly factor BamA